MKMDDMIIDVSGCYIKTWSYAKELIPKDG